MTEADEDSIVGFEDICGTENGIYVAGWGGEIWRSVSGKWTMLDSPVSANFNSITCCSDGRVFIVGDNGVMLVGEGENFKVLETNRKEDLQDVGYDGETVFVSTNSEILKLTDEGLVPETAYTDPEDMPDTCLHLEKCADGLVSVGPKDLFLFRNENWTRLA